MANLVENLSIKVALTNTCNFKCMYCMGSETVPYSELISKMEDFRVAPLETGNISTDQLLNVLRAFRQEGFQSIRPTGGEPTIRKDWDRIVNEAADMGYKGVDITTNGATLSWYLKNHEGKLPYGLSTVKVSLDTCDPDEFRKITGGGDRYKVMRGVEEIADQVWVRANTVLLRSNATPKKLSSLLNFAQKLRMKQVQFLDLVYYPNMPGADPTFWEKEFIAFPEFQKVMEQITPGIQFEQAAGQFGVNFHKATLDGLVITFKDSTSTMRDAMCETCPVYCQEGRCLVRVGTDGNVTFCPDYQGELWHFNGPESLQNGTFSRNTGIIKQIVRGSRRTRTIEIFAKRHNLRLPKDV